MTALGCTKTLHAFSRWSEWGVRRSAGPAPGGPWVFRRRFFVSAQGLTLRAVRSDPPSRAPQTPEVGRYRAPTETIHGRAGLHRRRRQDRRNTSLRPRSSPIQDRRTRPRSDRTPPRQTPCGSRRRLSPPPGPDPWPSPCDGIDKEYRGVFGRMDKGGDRSGTTPAPAWRLQRRMRDRGGGCPTDSALFCVLSFSGDAKGGDPRTQQADRSKLLGPPGLASPARGQAWVRLRRPEDDKPGIGP
jgi:hypothetical protein